MQRDEEVEQVHAPPDGEPPGQVSGEDGVHGSRELEGRFARGDYLEKRGVVPTGDEFQVHGHHLVQSALVPREPGAGRGGVFQGARDGLGGVFPFGLLVGTVTGFVAEAETGGFGLYRELILKPAAELSNITDVFVVIEVR